MSCDDAAADAAVLSQAVGKPVRVQWTREDEHRCSPLSSAMLIGVTGALDENAKMVTFDATQWLQTHSDSESGHHLAWEAIGTAPGRHDRWTGQIPSLWYEIDAKRNRSLFVKPLIRNIYMRGPGAVQGAFAFESFVDELAAAAHADPVEFRLSHTRRPSGLTIRPQSTPAQTLVALILPVVRLISTSLAIATRGGPSP